MADIQFFKDTLNSEIKRITELCDEWEKILLDNIPDEVHGKILSVIGQSKLLMSEKFQQFRELINSCNSSSNFSRSCSITVDDLRGFWDLVNIQIDDLNNKFKDLERLRLNNWIEQNRSGSNLETTSTNSAKGFRRQIPCDKIHTEAAKLRLAAAKERIQERMAKDTMKTDGFIIY